MTKNRSRRDYYRREHRTIGHYLMIQCWMEGSETLELHREDLRRLLETEQLRSERLEWLLEDLQPWFHVEMLGENGVKPSQHLTGTSKETAVQGLRLTQPSRPQMGPDEALKPFAQTRAADSEARLQHLLAMASGLSTPKRRRIVTKRRSASKGNKGTVRR